MNIPLVITILGSDRPGMVESLSNTLKQFQGSWTESRMTRLAGKFAGLLQVCVPEDQLDELTSALQKLETDDFKIVIEASNSTKHAESVKTLNLELLGQDRPGIIHDITRQLAKLDINIEELLSCVKEASMSGETLFCAELTLGLPEDISPDMVQDLLEEMSDQFMVDLNFST